jgi:hypothetical protein
MNKTAGLENPFNHISASCALLSSSHIASVAKSYSSQNQDVRLSSRFDGSTSELSLNPQSMQTQSVISLRCMS